MEVAETVLNEQKKNKVYSIGLGRPAMRLTMSSDRRRLQVLAPTVKGN
jgi:hypothetical protein